MEKYDCIPSVVQIGEQTKGKHIASTFFVGSRTTLPLARSSAHDAFRQRSSLHHFHCARRRSWKREEYLRRFASVARRASLRNVRYIPLECQDEVSNRKCDVNKARGKSRLADNYFSAWRCYSNSSGDERAAPSEILCARMRPRETAQRVRGK